MIVIDRVSLQIRMPGELHARVKEVARNEGRSLNGELMHLVALGLRLYDAELAICLREERAIGVPRD